MWCLPLILVSDCLYLRVWWSTWCVNVLFFIYKILISFTNFTGTTERQTLFLALSCYFLTFFKYIYLLLRNNNFFLKICLSGPEQVFLSFLHNCPNCLISNAFFYKVTCSQNNPCWNVLVGVGPKLLKKSFLCPPFYIIKPRQTKCLNTE